MDPEELSDDFDFEKSNFPLEGRFTGDLRVYEENLQEYLEVEKLSPEWGEELGSGIHRYRAECVGANFYLEEGRAQVFLGKECYPVDFSESDKAFVVHSSGFLESRLRYEIVDSFWKKIGSLLTH